MKKQLVAFAVALMIALPFATTMSAAMSAPTCEGECDSYYGDLINADSQVLSDCYDAYGWGGAVMCSPIVALMGAHMTAWGVCKAGCAGPYIMTAFRREDVFV